MNTQAASRRRFDGRQAPVRFLAVATPTRVSRACVGATVLALGGAGWAMAIPGAWWKAAAGALVLLHAVVDSRSKTALPALIVDAFCLTSTAGLGGELAGPLVGAAALVLAAAVLLLPGFLVPVPVAALIGGVVLRLAAFPSSSADAAAPAAHLAGVESVMYLIVLGLLGIGGAQAVARSRHRQEEALAAEQRAADIKDEFVSLVSHELRTPLTGISGFATALREAWRSLDPTEVDEFLELICGQTEHLRNLIDDVLVVPRLEADRLLIEPTDFQLRPAAYRIADLVLPPGGEKSVAVSVSGNVVVHADPNRVEQVLRNLLENAAKHGGSQVTVEASEMRDQWLVTVTDDGPGIPPEDRERIFAPFEQGTPSGASGKGMGLGLTVSRVLVTAMGGGIWYEPGFPTGSRFCFTLPAGASPSEKPAPAAALSA